MASITNLSGNIVNFSTSLEKPLQNLKIHFNPIQEGEGDPSPDNVRPITGWTGINLYHNAENMVFNETIPISWESEYGNIYGGYIDLVNGKIFNEMAFLHFIPSYIVGVVYDSNIDKYIAASATTGSATLTSSEIFSDKLAFSYDSSNKFLEDYYGYISGDRRLYFSVPSSMSTLDDVKSWMNDIGGFDVVYKRETPIEYDIDPITLKTIQGVNNIWSDSNGNIDISYLDRSGSMLEYRKNIIINNSPHIESVSDNIASFNTDMVSPLKDCKISFSPIQYGTGDPSPENIREIHGWTGMNVWQGKENKIVFLDPVTVSSNGITWTINPNGSISYEGTPTAFTGKMIGYYYVKGGEKIKIRMTGDTYNLTTDTCNIYDINNSLIGSIGDSVLHNRWVDLSEYPDAYKVRINLKRNRNDIYMHGTVYCDIDVNEVPSSTLFSISWETEYEEIYGGWINPLTGEVWKIWEKETFDGTESGWDTYISRHQIHFHRLIPDKKIGIGTSISSIFPNAKNTSFWDREKEYAKYGDHHSLPRIYVNAPYKMPNGVSEWREWLSNNPMELCYELATPVLVTTLTPTQIKSLRGINNIWTNSNGTTEIKYWTH